MNPNIETTNTLQTNNPITSDTIQSVNEVVVAAAPDKRRHFLAAFFLSFLFGIFGADRFYLGKVWTGILKLLTIGGYGIWAFVDLGMIISGSMRDKQGNELIDAAKYKKFAKKTVFIFTLITTIILCGILIPLVYFVIQFVQNGGLDGISELVTGASSGQVLNTSLGQTQGLLDELLH